MLFPVESETVEAEDFIMSVPVPTGPTGGGGAPVLPIVGSSNNVPSITAVGNNVTLLTMARAIPAGDYHVRARIRGTMSGPPQQLSWWLNPFITPSIVYRQWATYAGASLTQLGTLNSWPTQSQANGVTPVPASGNFILDLDMIALGLAAIAAGNAGIVMLASGAVAPNIAFAATAVWLEFQQIAAN